MAKGDVTIRFTSNDQSPGEAIQALMPEYNATSTDKIEALNRGSDFNTLVRQANSVALDDAKLTVEGNLGSALQAAYDKQFSTVEISHTTHAGLLGFGGTQEMLYKGSMTPELATSLEQAVTKIGNNLQTLAVECEKGTFTSSQCEELKQTVPSAIISDALGKSGNSR